MTHSGASERLGVCLGEVAEIRARWLREMLRAQGVALTGPTKVGIRSPAGEQEIMLVPDVSRILAPRWLIVAPCCAKRRLSLFWHPVEKRFGCRLCMGIRSARDRFRKNRRMAALLGIRPRGCAGVGASGRIDGLPDIDGSENDPEQMIEARLRELTRVSGAEGNHGGTAEYPQEPGGKENGP